MSEKKLKIFTGLLLIALIIIFIICYFYENKKGTDSDYVQIDTKGTALEAEYDNEELTGEWSDYTAKITLNDTKTIVEGKGVTNNGNIITRFGVVCVSNISSDKPNHISKLPKHTQQQIAAEVAQYGLTLEECSEDYKKRSVFNVNHLQDWADNYQYKGNDRYQKRLF